jgi:hypothetical protein
MALSRVQVYFRSNHGTRLSAPARLIWYMTGSRNPGSEPSAIVACSLLEDVTIDAPARLHGRFAHVGALTLEQIERFGARGSAQALQFTNTELFPRRVSGRAVAAVLAQRGTKPVLRGPLPISGSEFESLYRLAFGQ